jgi:signal transduction histidine kinase
MDDRTGRRRNPLVLLGAAILLVTGAAGVLADASPAAVLAQSSLPSVVGVAVLAYGWRTAGELDATRRTVLVWIGYGLFSFFVVGFYFGFVSRLFDTSFRLAVAASLSVGAAFGALVGVYAARLRSTNAELEAERDRLEQFAGVVSHDLRNPLNVAQGRLELLKADADDEHLDAIDRSLARMDTLIDDMLTLVRFGDDALQPEPVDVAALGRRSWDTVGTADATLVTETTGRVRADPNRLQQLLENLIRNAVEHGSTGSRSDPHGNAVEHGSTGNRAEPGDSVERDEEPLTVTIGDLDGGDGFYVADDGTGIPAGDADRILERGYSTTDAGTGLGLTIVQEIVDAHGWELRVSESEQGGARFEVAGVESE